MSAHRYWRWINIAVDGGYLEISELRVLNGSTPIAATMSSNPLPLTGGETLSNLADGNLGTRVYWYQSDAQAPTFWVMADLGTAQVVTGMQIGAFDTANRYPSAITLQWSDDNSSWTTFGTWSGLTYPGNNTAGPVLTP